ncbi:MAG: NTP transferase domain-containing protein [Planctomycetaceae bacterium]|nr:NTP transferase domain-containing protein [Planctomycetaceae bacterium]
MLHAVIMAGGSGTRFWPLSRQAVPKQFLQLGGDRSLIQQAFDRCQPWIPGERMWVVTNARLAELTHEHLPEVPRAHILQEPCARNTAPCVALAAMCLLQEDPDAVMLVMPADHVIGPAEQFHDAVERASRLVAQDPEQLVLFGVPPNAPSTGYGYIERGDTISGHDGAFVVKSFREKPNRDTAEEYLRAGTFFWNCGIFVWRADRILAALRQHEPNLVALVEQLRSDFGRPTWDATLAELFPQMKSISIDYAVLEHEQRISVVEAPFDWDDVGSWLAMERLHGHDGQQNTIVGLHRGVRTHNCIIRSGPDHLIATLGIENCIIVHTPQATLVADRREEGAMRELVDLLGKAGDDEYL